LPRVVFTDCDGTLLGPDHRLSPRVRDSLRALTDAGVRVVPATGRARSGPWIEHVLTEPALRFGSPGIFLNGCSNFDELGIEHVVTLPPAAAHAAVEFGQARRAHATTVVYTRGEALVETDDALTARLSAVGDSPLRRVDCLRAALADDSDARAVAKVLLLCDRGEEAMSALRADAEHAIAGAAEQTRALHWCLEIKPLGACKATAASALLQRWGIDAADALALGDGENDVSLLKLCGASVAMGNGCDHAKAAAMYLAPSNARDGWAVAIESLVLGAR
jgi:Cof subfamily protein (haloacid dehalogenase superfamily)